MTTMKMANNNDSDDDNDDTKIIILFFQTKSKQKDRIYEILWNLFSIKILYKA